MDGIWLGIEIAIGLMIAGFALTVIVGVLMLLGGIVGGIFSAVDEAFSDIKDLEFNWPNRQVISARMRDVQRGRLSIKLCWGAASF